MKNVTRLIALLSIVWMHGCVGNCDCGHVETGAGGGADVVGDDASIDGQR